MFSDAARRLYAGRGERVELDVLIREWRSRAQRPILVALDGRSGVGKTTLAADIARRHDGAVIVADDFYSGASDADWQRLPAPDRVARVIDWQRLRTEALEQPLLDGRTARWRPFDWQAGQDTSNDLLEQQPVPMVVLDGAYSARPELADLIDIAVLLQLDDGTRRSRLIAREGARFMQRWHAIWDPAEDYYFTQVRPAASFDLVLEMG